MFTSTPLKKEATATAATATATAAAATVPFDVLDTRRKVLNFRKLMQMFPIVHPAALHALLVRSNYDAGYVMDLLYRVSAKRNEEYRKRVQAQNDKAANVSSTNVNANANGNCEEPQAQEAGNRYNLRVRKSVSSLESSAETDC